MDDLFHHLRLLESQCRSEHRRVAPDAYRLNVRWMSSGAPVLAAVLLVAAGLSLWSMPGPDIPGRWNMVALHGVMAVAVFALALCARQVAQARHTLLHVVLTLSCTVLFLANATVLAALQASAAAGVSVWLLGCMAVAVLVLQRPLAAAGVLVVGYAALLWLADPALRLQSMAATALALAVSVRNWRTFTQLSLQGLELERTRTELQQRQRDLERMTRQDSLTGLFNSKTFTEVTKLELDRTKRQGTPTSILLVDLDHFKKVNDTHGHPAGDAVLRHVATLLATGVRNTDLVGRLGGEEFIILLPATSIESAQRLAEKLRQRLQASPVLWVGNPIQMTASFGLAVSTSFLTLDFDTLYNTADKALYLAKSSGRNRVMT